MHLFIAFFIAFIAFFLHVNVCVCVFVCVPVKDPLNERVCVSHFIRPHAFGSLLNRFSS